MGILVARWFTSHNSALRELLCNRTVATAGFCAVCRVACRDEFANQASRTDYSHRPIAAIYHTQHSVAEHSVTRELNHIS